MQTTVKTHKQNVNQTINAWNNDYDICLEPLCNDMEG